MRFVFLFLSIQLLAQTKPSFNPDKSFTTTDNNFIPINKAEFTSTFNWIKGKVNQDITYYSADNTVYTIVSEIKLMFGTILSHHFYTLVNYKKDDRDFGIQFNVKDISDFEIYDSDISDKFFYVRLYTYNSERKIKWASDNIFDTYKTDNWADITFPSSVDKAKVKKAFTDLLKYAGSKKEKY
jgi:hypothetical protein